MTHEEKITFSDIGVSIDFLKILNAKKLINPTPIQKKCISLGLSGKDIIGIAQTGTGKTLAFGLPLLEKIKQKRNKAIILLPTRELALQVNEVLSSFGRPFRIRTALIIGGSSARPQKSALMQNPDIIIATPGRLIDHIQQRNCNLKNISIVILDEADRMLDIGFMPQIRQILSSVPKDRQTMLFSATMPDEIAELSKQYMRNPVRIEVAPSGTSAKNINQSAYIVSSKNKEAVLKKVITENQGSILVFTRTKYKSKKVAYRLRQLGFKAVEMHSNRSLAQRKTALAGFKSGKFRILVATDVAARGLDVKDISVVVNFDLPDSPEDYVHRIGRTGRANKSGEAIAFIEPNEKDKLRRIERLIKKNLKLISSPEKLVEVRAPRPNRQSYAKSKHSSTSQWAKNKRAPKKRTQSYNRSKKARPSRPFGNRNWKKRK